MQNDGPRADQVASYKWFEEQGWLSEWPLHYAAMKGDVVAIRELTSIRQVDPNVKMTPWVDSEPLGWAASFGELKAVIALIQAGADPLRPANKAGFTPLTDAMREKKWRTVRFLNAYTEIVQSLQEGSQVEDVDSEMSDDNDIVDGYDMFDDTDDDSEDVVSDISALEDRLSALEDELSDRLDDDDIYTEDDESIIALEPHMMPWCLVLGFGLLIFCAGVKVGCLMACVCNAYRQQKHSPEPSTLADTFCKLHKEKESPELHESLVV